MTQKSLVEIYEPILKTGWLICDKDTKYVYRDLKQVSGEEREPFILLEKHVALPTRENLNNSGKNNLLIFHPLLEGLMGAESPVVGKLRRAYGIRFTYVATTLFSTLLAGATHESEVAKFSPDQFELLKAVGEADEKTIKTWDKIVKLAMDKFGASNAFADVYTSRNTTLKGEHYSRVCSVRFPIYDELAKDEDKFFGSTIQIRKSDRKIYMKLFEYMFSKIDTKDAYSYGTNSRLAPYLDALLHVFGHLFSITNAIYDLFHNVILMEENVRVELEWIDDFKDIENLKNIAQSVPQQYGNYPIKVEDEKRQATGSIVTPMDVQKRSPIAQALGQSLLESPEPPQNKIQNSNYSGALGSSLSVIKAATPVDTEEFQGLGTPLSEANGGPAKKQEDLKAVMVDSVQANVVLHPEQVLMQTVNEISKRGGVGRVTAANANMRAVQAQQFQPTFNPQNTNGWNNNYNTFNNQGQNVSAAMVARNQALVRIQSQPSPFASTGMFGRSVI